MSSSNVRKGQLLCCADRASTVWQVLEVSSDPIGILHAQLCKVERPYELKTLCCSLLDDPRCYCLVSDESDAGVASSPRRPKNIWKPSRKRKRC
jgi:hypothetical protein